MDYEKSISHKVIFRYYDDEFRNMIEDYLSSRGIKVPRDASIKICKDESSITGSTQPQAVVVEWKDFNAIKDGDLGG